MRFACLLIFASAALSACTTPRYVGSISADGTYVNRGYGVVATLGKAGLSERWIVIDPTAPEAAPPHRQPRFSESPIDVDGDGYLDVLERTGHLEPPLRLLSRTSSAAQIDLDVRILGGNLESVPLDAVVIDALKSLAPTSSAAVSRAIKIMERPALPGDYPARRTVLDTRDSNNHLRQLYLLFVEQNGFEAEERIVRRQLLVLTLSAPRLDEGLKQDHALFTSHLILSRKGSSTTTQEEW